MNKTLSILAVAAAAVSLAAPASAHYDGDRDRDHDRNYERVYGSGTVEVEDEDDDARLRLWASVRSDRDDDDARGRVWLRLDGETLRGRVDCLDVDGDRAGLTGEFRNADDRDHRYFLIQVEDNDDGRDGDRDGDRYNRDDDQVDVELSDDEFSSRDCEADGARNDIERGNFTVRD